MRWVSLVLILVMCGCAGVPLRVNTKALLPEEIRKGLTEEEKILSTLSRDDQYIVRAFLKESQSQDIFVVVSWLKDYNAEPKLEGFFRYLNELPSNKVRFECYDEYFGKIRRHYQFILEIENVEE